MVLITPIGDNLEVGTRIHWDEPTQSLYYVDVPQCTIHKYKPSTNVLTKAIIGTDTLAFAFPVEGKNDQFIAGIGRNLVILRWDGESNSVCSCNVIAEIDRNIELSTNRFNGAKVDPYGRLWAGTMGPQNENNETVPERGSLYSVTQGRVKRHLSKIGISNGLAFDVERNKMYYIDTLFPGVYQFDYDGELGEIQNQKVIFKFEAHSIEGLPDGMTIDTDGNLWVTAIFGSVILKIDPVKKTLLKKIEMPTPQITSLAFGGKHLNTLYVTTAQIAVNGKKPDEPAGCTFKVEHIGSAKGLPGCKYIL